MPASTRLARLVQTVFFWIPLGLATVAALLPQGAPMPLPISDVLLHAFAFTYLTAALGLVHYPPARRWPVALWMLCYGVALEVLQSFIPERSAEVKDVIVDAVGIVLGLGLRRLVADVVGARPPGWGGDG